MSPEIWIQATLRTLKIKMQKRSLPLREASDSDFGSSVLAEIGFLANEHRRRIIAPRRPL